MSRLDDDLRGLVGYSLQRAQSAVTAQVNRILENFGLRRVSYSVLAVVVSHPGLKQADIAKVLSVERPNLVRVVDMLEADGWIERKRLDGDRRAYQLRPTKLGRSRFERARAALFAFDTTLTEALGEKGRTRLIADLEAIEAVGIRNEEWEASDANSAS